MKTKEDLVKTKEDLVRTIKDLVKTKEDLLESFVCVYFFSTIFYFNNTVL